MINTFTQKSIHGSEILGRKCLNRVSGLFNRKFINQANEIFSNIDTKSPDYIYALSGAGRVFAQNMEIEINSEAKIIEKLARDKKAHIFIMNHDNQARDPKMLGFFNTLLNDEYVVSGNAATCPRSRIILNEDILNTMNSKMRNIFEKLGAIGIDASLDGGNKVSNGKKMAQLMREYINGESNIYIFPEGKKCAYKYLPLKERFQPGIANIIEKLTSKTDVSTVPLAFAYNKSNKTLASMQIGEPITFSKNSGETKDNILDKICNALENTITEAKNKLPQKSLGELAVYV